MTSLLLAGCLGAGCLGGDGADPDKDGTVPPAAECPTATTPGTDPPQPSLPPRPVREGFEATQAGQVPTGWTATDGAWAVQSMADSLVDRNVLYGEGDVDPGFSALVVGPAGDLADFEASVAFRMDCVQHPHGVGVVLHVQDADDYQIIRYSASESAWDFFTVVAGVRIRHPEAAVQPGTDPGPDEWATLRVTSSGDRLRAFDGDALVIDQALGAGNATSGQFGLFLRGNSSAWFDDVAVDDLPPVLP